MVLRNTFGSYERRGLRRLEKIAYRGALRHELTRFYSGVQNKKKEMDGVCSMYGGRSAYRGLVGKTERKRALGRPRGRG
jgi:hypothetical protein